MTAYEPVRCPHGVVVAYNVRATVDDPVPVIDDWCPTCRLGATPEDKT